jgi:hypothetical protein
MAAVNPPYAIQARADHPARLFRELLASLRGQQGVIAAADLNVTANGTPNMSVNVAAGKAVVDGTQSFAAQGSYLVFNDATWNLTIAAADATNPRRDLIVAQVRDAEYAGANNDWLLAVIQGTPAPSPVDPAVPANSLTLARVLVGAAVSSITTPNITDLRPSGALLNNLTAPAAVNPTAQVGTSPLAARADHQHTMPQYRFSAQPNATQAITASTFTKVALQTENYDDGGVFDNATNYRFTNPGGMAGKWQFTFCVAISLGGQTARVIASLYLNGAEIATSRASQYVAAINQLVNLTGAIVLNLAATNFIELFVWHNGGVGAATLQSGSETSHLTGIFEG